MRTDDLDYVLPVGLIAQTPAAKRDEARLMVIHIGEDHVAHSRVSELPHLLRRGDLLVLNQTKVLPARFYGKRQATGGVVEGLFLETRDDVHWHVLLKSGGRLRRGERISLGEEDHVELGEQQADGSWFVIKRSQRTTEALLEHIGTMPLPPYIDRTGNKGTKFVELDRQRYQTVYAQQSGAVAAPTAGLHFTPELLETLKGNGIETAKLTLHVGMGTFAPVRAVQLEDHVMHSERFIVPRDALLGIKNARRERRRIIAVGTTSVRAMESLPAVLPEGDHEADTELLIQPGFPFRYTDGLMTNFHLPRSTLLALVGALTGMEKLKHYYAEAIRAEYRFYSYGDAMLILPD